MPEFDTLQFCIVCARFQASATV